MLFPSVLSLFKCGKGVVTFLVFGFKIFSLRQYAIGNSYQKKMGFPNSRNMHVYFKDVGVLCYCLLLLGIEELPWLCERTLLCNDQIRDKRSDQIES